MTKKEQKNLLNKYANLKEDWNGYGSKPLSKKVIEKCKAIIEKLPGCFYIFPTARDSIQIKIELSGDYLEFEVYESRIVCFVESGINHFEIELKSMDDVGYIANKFLNCSYQEMVSICMNQGK